MILQSYDNIFEQSLNYYKKHKKNNIFICLVVLFQILRYPI